MDDSLRVLIFKLIDQTISADELDRLQDAMERDVEVRSEYLRAVALDESLSDIASGLSDENRVGIVRANFAWTSDKLRPSGLRRLSLTRLAIAAVILIAVGATAFWLGQQNDDKTLSSDQELRVADQLIGREEPQIAGHATLRRSVDLNWSSEGPQYRDGDVLTNGRLQFDEGVAEIDFFCGATLIVEGPAILDIESDWSVGVANGRLRANVPPAARGFFVKAAGSQIVDLGTEFALEVESGNARVEVIDGEVEIRGGQHDGSHLLTGQRQWIKGTETPAAFDGLSTLDELVLRRDNATSQRLVKWQKHSQGRRLDDRLIAYFPMVNAPDGRVVRNAARTGELLDGKLVGPVELATGRFGVKSSGLAFGRPGSRVRTRIDGEFEAFTFTCWVRIDSLEHAYNALFMSDGYETGELHWQIRDDGSLMFSVMVDDTKSTRHFSKLEQREVQTAGIARVYYSEPIWDLSKSGQWFHLAAVYDPAERRVVQYANGVRVGDEEIIEKFYIDTLRIGPAEIGNWGQPFRKTPAFAVRNLNGTIDELAVYDAPLTADEIRRLYQEGKPLGY